MRAAVLVAAVLGASAGVLGQARPSILAVDQGTYLQPIARLEGTRWVEVPPSGLGQLAPLEWTRFYSRGSSVSIKLSVAEPTGRCATPRRLAIATPPAASAGNAGVDSVYVGLAASTAVAVEPLRTVTSAVAEWATLTAAIGRIFSQRENDHGVAAASLSRVPMTVDHAYAAGAGKSGGTYYFEASKRVPDAGNTPEEDPKGIVRIVVSGWLIAGSGGFAPAGTKGELSWEPAEAKPPVAPVLSPLGVVRHGAERLWVMRSPLGNRDRFTIYSLGTTTVRTLFTVDSGAC